MLKRLRRRLNPRLRLNGLLELARTFGWCVGLGRWLCWQLSPGRHGTYPLRAPGVRYPVHARINSSDLDLFREIFIDQEYSCLDDLAGVDLIIDCGANVGYSSSYFLSRHPDARVIAVEPDPENFNLLRRNVAPYGSRVQLVNAAVWSHPARLTFSDEPYRDGRQWTKQVRESGSGEPADVEATDIESLAALAGNRRISILKIDIEGAEAVVFSQNYEPWLDRVDAMVIELHDDSFFGKASDIFFAAIKDRGFTVSTCKELTICKRARTEALTGRGQYSGIG